MQGNLLHPNEVVSAGRSLRDSKVDLSRAILMLIPVSPQFKNDHLPIRRPSQRLPAEYRSLLENLEPHRPATVPVRGRLARGYLGHIHEHGARVVDVGRDGHAGRRAGGDIEDAGCEVCSTCYVAADVERGHVLHGSVGVVVCPLAHVLPVGRCSTGGGEHCGQVVVRQGGGEEGEEG